MKSVLLIGLGRFGRHVARKLNEMNHQVLAVDQKRKESGRCTSIFDKCTDWGQHRGGIRTFIWEYETFDVCIVAIGDAFQSSLETTSRFQKIWEPEKLWRVRQEMFMRSFLLRNGADHVVYPGKAACSMDGNPLYI